MTKELNKKNIWIFHHYATPPTMNGFTRPYNFGLYLDKNKYSLKVFAASYLHFSDTNLIKDNQLYINNIETEIPFVFINTPSSSGNGVGRILNMIGFYRNLFKVTKKLFFKGEKPDLIIASSPHPLTMIAGIKIAKKLNIPCVCEVRDFWPEVIFLGGRLKEDSIVGKLLLKGEHWIYNKSDALVFLKEGDFTYITDRKWDVAQGGNIELDKCYYINNGVDFEVFNEQIKNNQLIDEDIDSKTFNVVYTGALRPVNNIGNILNAAKLLINKEVQFLIYGNGTQLEILKKRVKDENITNVKIKGYVDKKNIPYILTKSSINILNYSQSKYNWSRGNSSNKLFEYMASGKPIISTVKMGYSPIEKYDCGISLEEDTPKALAEAVLRIYNMSKDRYNEMGKNAKNGALDFDYKELTKKLVAVMESLF